MARFLGLVIVRLDLKLKRNFDECRHNLQDKKARAHSASTALPYRISGFVTKINFASESARRSSLLTHYFILLEFLLVRKHDCFSYFGIINFVPTILGLLECSFSGVRKSE